MLEEDRGGGAIIRGLKGGRMIIAGGRSYTRRTRHYTSALLRMVAGRKLPGAKFAGRKLMMNPVLATKARLTLPKPRAVLLAGRRMGKTQRKDEGLALAGAGGRAGAHDTWP